MVDTKDIKPPKSRRQLDRLVRLLFFSFCRFGWIASLAFVWPHDKLIDVTSKQPQPKEKTMTLQDAKTEAGKLNGKHISGWTPVVVEFFNGKKSRDFNIQFRKPGTEADVHFDEFNRKFRYVPVTV